MSKVTYPTVQSYLDAVPEERKLAFDKIRQTILDHLPAEFEECISYNMIGYVVPKSIYSEGYHCDPKLPLPFASIANQKNFIALYHMGIYAKPELLKWWQEAYPKYAKYKLDMGKSCIRFKKMEDIPFELIGQLFEKMTVDEWIEIYEQNIKS